MCNSRLDALLIASKSSYEGRRESGLPCVVVLTRIDEHVQNNCRDEVAVIFISLQNNSKCSHKIFFEVFQCLSQYVIAKCNQPPDNLEKKRIVKILAFWVIYFLVSFSSKNISKLLYFRKGFDNIFYCNIHTLIHQMPKKPDMPVVFPRI